MQDIRISSNHRIFYRHINRMFYVERGEEMEEKIKLIYGNDAENAIEILNKLKAEQKILELFETKEIEKVEITYKKEPVHCECTSSTD